ncbi:MAG: VWA domain-containing protein [Acidobacteriota bacterium]
MRSLFRKGLIPACLFLLAAPECTVAQTVQTQADRSSPTFAVQSQLVQIHLTVQDGARLVTDLGVAGFALFEDGVEKEVYRLDSTSIPLQVALLLDTSGSMRDALEETREAAVSFVSALREGDRVTFIPFQTHIRSFAQSTEDTGPIVRAIRSTRAGGATKLYEALLFAMKSLSGKAGRKAIVVFSDGEDTARSSSLNMVVNAAGRFGYPIYAIAAGAGRQNENLKRVLRQLSEMNSGKLLFGGEPGGLRDAFSKVAEELRSAYLLNYYTDVPFDGRWHDLEVRAADPRHRIQHRRGFYARTVDSKEILAGRPDQREDRPQAFPAPLVQGAEVEDPAAAAALAEFIQQSESSARASASLLAALPAAATDRRQEKPVFKVESRFVEVPVFVESLQGKEPPGLSREDFRIYENNLPKEIVFFSKDVRSQDLEKVRDAATKEVRADGSPSYATSDPGDEQDLVLGRYYLVLDDLLSKADHFLQMKKAAKLIIQEHHAALHPFSLHFTSEGKASNRPSFDREKTLATIDNSVSRATADLDSSNNVMTIYEAFLIEKGDAKATQLAELRLAATLALEFDNELGGVEGMSSSDLIDSNVRMGVQTMARELIAENHGLVSRALDTLKSVLSAAAAEGGTYPKTIILISSGFAVGRESGRSTIDVQMGNVVRRAKAAGIRIFTVDAAGLEILSPLELRAKPAFLVRNPHLETLLYDHASGWKLERESALNQLAVETGGRFLHMTNDLSAAAGAAMRRTGHLYYLGYLSRQPPDGRYHRIRVTTSLQRARIHTRNGFTADGISGRQRAAAGGPDGGEARDLLVRAETAQKSMDHAQVIASLTSLVQKYPDQAVLWYNLGTAHHRLDNREQAVEALQQAFSLAPQDKEIGLAFSRALMNAHYRAAAAETLQIMIRNRPRDLQLLVQLGRVYEADSNLQQAYRAYRRVLDLTPEPPLDLYVLLLRTAGPLGRDLEAEIFIEDYLARGGAEERIEPYRHMLARTAGGTRP